MGATMPTEPNARIHATAVVSSEAELAPDVVVGPYAVIEGPVRLGAGCEIRPHVHLIGPLTMGCRNQVYTGAVLGERPQHQRFTDAPSGLVIGDDNIFREHVTIHQGTKTDQPTRIGHRNFFMAHSHLGHDCQVANNCILANGALLAGHCQLCDGVYVSGNSAVHQFVRLGRLSLLSGGSTTSKDIPPFVIQHSRNYVAGVNVIGMRRSGCTAAQVDAVRRAFHMLFLQGMNTSNALLRIQDELGEVDVIQELIAFIRSSTRGINSNRDKDELADAA
jgi:UDP-N-acetylglucosamine acyltransferase